MVYFLEDDNNLIDNLNNNKRQKTEHTTIIIEKKIILPLIIQKYIIELIYKHNRNLYKKSKKYNYKKNDKILNYGLVNWNWFKFCQIYHHYYQEPTIQFKISKQIKESTKKIKNLNLFKKVQINLNEINNKSILLLNSFKSLNQIIIQFKENYEINNDYKNLIHLNELNKNIILNFNINIKDINKWEMNFKFKKEIKELFKFEINNIKFKYNENDDDYYEETEEDEELNEGRFKVLLEVIKFVNPKSIEFDIESDNYYKHLPIYHSLSKFNQKFQNVKIQGDFIPIFSFYRFLKAPNLKTLDIQFQFHFLLSIYNQVSFTSDVKRIYNKFNLNFDEIDNFKETLEIERKEEQVYNGDDYTASVGIDFNDNTDDGTVSLYDPNNSTNKNSEINENKQRYCYRFYDSQVNNLSVPKYTRSLWNDCLYQLENNKTIKNLSIGNVYCPGCNIDQDEDEDNHISIDHQLFKDLSNSLANNKSIETLTLNLPTFLSSDHIESNAFILDILDNNSTLKQLYINSDNEISLDASKNKNCKIYYINNDD